MLEQRRRGLDPERTAVTRGVRLAPRPLESKHRGRAARASSGQIYRAIPEDEPDDAESLFSRHCQCV
jgi:hypothetical protein